MKKILKKIIIIVLSIVLLLFIGLSIYARNPYTHLQSMDDQIANLDTSQIQIEESARAIKYTVNDPIKNILFIPGGLVEPVSYSYLAVNLALVGYNVTIFKPFYDLAILSPNLPKRYLDKDLENVVIGHSLGGVVASMISSNNDLVDEVVLLGSYPIKSLTDKKVLIVTAEFDLGMDQDKFNNAVNKYVNDETEIYNIEGGNHAQFGWYGPQKGDGEANIDTVTQQTIVFNLIYNFIK